MNVKKRSGCECDGRAWPYSVSRAGSETVEILLFWVNYMASLHVWQFYYILEVCIYEK